MYHGARRNCQDRFDKLHELENDDKSRRRRERNRRLATAYGNTTAHGQPQRPTFATQEGVRANA